MGKQTHLQRENVTGRCVQPYRQRPLITVLRDLAVPHDNLTRPNWDSSSAIPLMLFHHVMDRRFYPIF